ncbi:UPF0510 protein INM02-like [Tropilaelaps mercedesae]|uniref:ER membrane protein complex subunit 10 n=1 Tax=Tropilaelaps mercedesae TaxID=418985 RepID=A0A1V9XUD9_9ACAR|nr:UPF0510 protein INM02-like [Tropilaelaps mercedesae]
MRLFWLVSLASVFLCSTSANAQEVSPVLLVLHALEYEGTEPMWTSRAKITINSLTQSTAIAETNLVTAEDEAKLARLLADGWYKLKVIDTATGNHVIAWTPHDKPLSQGLKVSLDPSGFLESVSFLPPGSLSSGLNNSDRFLYIQIDVMKTAPSPETATYIQRLEMERREKEKSQGQDNRSFLSKYWMYIVPIAIFMLISGASNPEEQ